MPKPQTGESRADYLDRCMGSAEMRSEFPDSDQRYAVCISYWEDEEKAEGHKPTEAMATAARRALEWRKEYNRGGTAVGVARARNIANRDSLSLSTVNRMVSFFARHGTNRSKHYSAKEPDGGPTAWRIAWDLWGGDAGRTWANGIADREDEKSMNEFDYKSMAFELKEVDSDGRISGYGSVFGNIDEGGDVVARGAFKQTCEACRMGTHKIKMLWQHDPSQPIGVWDTAREDDKGLFLQGRVLAGVEKGREAIELIRAGAIDGLSMGYKTLDAEYHETDRGTYREIKEAEVWETSLVTFPMNRMARLTDVKQLDSPRDVEQLLRKSGVPGTFAKLLALHGYEGAMDRLHADPRDEGRTKADEQALAGLMSKLQGLKEAFNA